MSRLDKMLALVGVACAVSSSTLVLGQVQTGAVAPPQPPAGKQGAAVKNETGKNQQAPAAPAAVREAVVKTAPMQAQVAQAQIDAQAAQYVQQLRPIFRGEYYFIRNVCGLDADQRRRLARMGEAVVKNAGRQLAEAQQVVMRGGWRPGMANPDPHKLIEQQLTKDAIRLLTHEQAARYKAELDKRAHSQKQLAIDNLVAKLDDDLFLTSDQRSKLVNALGRNWEDSWFQSLEMLQNIDSFYPNVPDEVVTPILTNRQKEVWRGIPKNQNVFLGFMMNGVLTENDPLDDPELNEARREAETREGK